MAMRCQCYDNGDNDERLNERWTCRIQCSTIDVDSTYSYKGWQKWMVDYLFLISAQRITVILFTINQSSCSLRRCILTNNIQEGMETWWYFVFENGWRLGMIQNCKLYNRVFVTIDKMAAMFAIFRGVKTVYLGIEVGQYIRECRRV
jgi:hypothetical protein